MGCALFSCLICSTTDVSDDPLIPARHTQRVRAVMALFRGEHVADVSAHRTNIMRRLNIHSVAELVRYAIRDKIIETV